MWALLLGAVAHSLTFVTVLCNDGFSGHLVRLTFHALLSTHHSVLFIFCCPMIMVAQSSCVSSNMYILHIGCAINLHPITNLGLIPGGQNSSKRQTVFCTSVDPMNKDHKDPNNIDLEAPRLAWYKQKTWKKRQNTVYWVDIKLAQKKGFKF